MKWDSVEGVARTLLYEGYLLYTYRKSSIKNAQRWAFGSLYPPVWAEYSSEHCRTGLEVLVVGADPSIALRAAFLLWCERVAFGEGPRREAVEHSVEFELTRMHELVAGRRVPFSFAARTWKDGTAHYSTRATEGFLEVRAERVGTDVFKLGVRLENTSRGGNGTDDDERLRALASAHLFLGTERGAFVSQLEPPAELAKLTHGCRNEGVWPVLVGDPARRDRMLASPVVLYDYPALTRESPGDVDPGRDLAASGQPGHRFFFAPDEMEQVS